MVPPGYFSSTERSFLSVDPIEVTSSDPRVGPGSGVEGFVSCVGPVCIQVTYETSTTRDLVTRFRDTVNNKEVCRHTKDRYSI